MTEALRQVDYRTALAGALFDSPGVYAVLIGSGVSSEAGILTGWNVARELVRRVARDQNVDIDEDGMVPEKWWEQEGYGTLSYSNLINGLASTELARRALLRQFFEPGSNNQIAPSPAHRSLAQLCANELVKVIITTNFDPLIERALDEQGLSPQVISSESQIKGMTPLHHAPLSVIKVHGDYASPELKNTDLELSSFGPEMNALLDEVLDRFGLVSVGWSATWDHALREAMERRPSRRYPTYYAAHDGRLSEAAIRLTTQQEMHIINISGASAFFNDLVDRVNILFERSRRRALPRRSKEYRYHINSTPPQWWKQMPLLTIRVVSSIGGVAEDVEIGPDERDKLVAALSASKVVARLRNLQGIPLKAKFADEPSSNHLGSPAFVGLLDWEFEQNANQNDAHAVYRVGTDGSSGISAVAEVRGPSLAMNPSSVVCVIDMGFSVEQALQLESIAELICTGLVAVTAEMPIALAEIIPPDADVNMCEIQLFASYMNSDNTMRSNAFADLIDLSLVNSPKYPTPREQRQQIMYAAILTGALSLAEAAQITVDAIGVMVKQLGYMDPRAGQESIQKTLEQWAKV